MKKREQLIMLPIKECITNCGNVYALECKICGESIDILDDTWKWRANHMCFKMLPKEVK